MIQIYYGFGKGKTTAAIGQGMRAKGAGNTVTLVQFLKDNKSSELSVLPFDIFNAPDTLPLGEKRATVKVLKSMDKWYGVTYKEDKPVVVAAIQNLKDGGLYPQKLWEE